MITDPAGCSYWEAKVLQLYEQKVKFKLTPTGSSPRTLNSCKSNAGSQKTSLAQHSLWLIPYFIYCFIAGDKI